MSTPLRLLVTGESAIAAAALLAHGLHVQAHRWPVALRTWTPRDRASEYFQTLYASSLAGTALLLRDAWLDEPYGCQPMPKAMQRMLERFALGLGMVLMPTDDVSGGGCLPLVPPPEDAEDVDAVLDQAHEERWLNAGPGSGAWRPGKVTLLVGDRPNNGVHGDLKHKLPFFSLHSGGCSQWLAQQLEDAGVPESELYWVNSADARGVDTDAAFLRELRPKRIIAMGDYAQRWVSTYLPAGMESLCHGVAHPQYHKRFKHGQTYPLLDLLTRSEIAA